MDWKFTAGEERFREELRQFLADNLPADWSERSFTEGPDSEERIQLAREITKKLADRRWLAMAWPEQYGGLDATHMQQLIYNEETSYQAMPGGGGMGVAWVGPAIMLYGTEEQKREYIPRITNADDVWCTLYSEPSAGSDLASLQTRAVRDGDEYVINGQKIWTSIAHWAKWMIVLARTDPDAPKHKGITYFILDMKAPGVTVQPLMNMADTHEFNEVFFDNVRVPKENIIGEENRGWYTAVTTLDFERSAIGSAIGMKQSVEVLVDYAREHLDDHTSTLDKNPFLRYELSDRMVEVEVARMLSYRVASLQNRGLIPNYEASMMKLYNTELNQRIARTGQHILGLYGQLSRGEPLAPNNGRNCYTYIRSSAYTIEGGTSEVQRNIVAQRGLGLPRD
jgi:alkylation response protein AidB-like acyl-CoA dehydrogenase